MLSISQPCFLAVERSDRITPKVLSAVLGAEIVSSGGYFANGDRRNAQRLLGERTRARAYRVDKSRRCPRGADRGAIGDIYRNCQSGYVVDHIIPLRGKYVGGLNVPRKLQEAESIMRKSNRWFGCCVGAGCVGAFVGRQGIPFGTGRLPKGGLDADRVEREASSTEETRQRRGITLLAGCFAEVGDMVGPRIALATEGIGCTPGSARFEGLGGQSAVGIQPGDAGRRAWSREGSAGLRPPKKHGGLTEVHRQVRRHAFITAAEFDDPSGRIACDKYRNVKRSRSENETEHRTGGLNRCRKSRWAIRLHGRGRIAFFCSSSPGCQSREWGE